MAKLDYQLNTAYNYVVVSIATSNASIAEAVINAVPGNTANITLVEQQSISISLTAAGFNCMIPGSNYHIDATPGIVLLHDDASV